VSEPARSAIWQAARALVGVPFRPQGRNADVGVDCIGLVVLTAEAVGLTLPDVRDYHLSDHPARLWAGLRAAGFQPVTEPQPGDLVLLRIASAARHLAIASPIGLIHAHAQLRRVVEHGWDASWRDRLAAAFAFPPIPKPE
jgi:cell wall-associated NlpC family hydrolase